MARVIYFNFTLTKTMIIIIVIIIIIIPLWGKYCTGKEEDFTHLEDYTISTELFDEKVISISILFSPFEYVKEKISV